LAPSSEARSELPGGCDIVGNERNDRGTGAGGAQARIRPGAPGPELLGNREVEVASDRAQKAHPRTGIAWQLRMGPGASAASADAERAEPEHGPGPTGQVRNSLAAAKGKPQLTAPRRPTPEPELLGNWGLGHGPGSAVQDRSCLATAKGKPHATAPRRPTPEPELLGNCTKGWAGRELRSRPAQPVYC